MANLPKGTPLVVRLLKHSDPVPSGCWEWNAGKGSDGYGAIKVDGRQWRAHVIACQLANGDHPDGKPFALHRCDNPPCINPDHLYWGDKDDNMKDRLARGRWYGGIRRRKRACIGHEFTPRGNGSCKHCRKDYKLP